MVELLPSILSADFANLARDVAAAERGGGTVIHVDVIFYQGVIKHALRLK